jgi:hypothetical protein
MLLQTILFKESLDNLYSFLLLSQYIEMGTGGMLIVEGQVWISFTRYYGDVVIISLHTKLLFTIHCPQM